MGLALPGHVQESREAKQAQMQQIAQLNAMRINIASSLYGQFMAVDYKMAMEAVDRERSKFGVPEYDDDKPSEPIPFSIDMGRPAKIAARASAVLMGELGLLSPEQVKAAIES